MGYRIKLNKLSKEEYKTFKDIDHDAACGLNKDCCDGEEKYPISVSSIGNELYCFGKYCEWVEGLETNHGTPFFSNKELQKYYNVDGDMFLITKDGFKYIIEMYANIIKEYYQDLKNSLGDTEKIGRHFKSQLSEWENTYVMAYNSDCNKEFITSSWKIEYSIFELVRLYKTVKDDDVLFISGW